MGKKSLKEAYIARVLAPVEDADAQEEISLELSVHIDERIEFYKEIGYDDETAEKKAIEDMGDPEPVGASLSRLHPKGRVITAVLAVLPLFLIVLPIHWTAILWVGDMGISFFEFMLILYIVGVSLLGERRQNRLLCALSVLAFCLAYGVYIFALFSSHPTAVYSPMVLDFFCILTGDSACMDTYPVVEGVTVAPWLTAASCVLYFLLFVLLVSALVSVCKLQASAYSRMDQKVSKAIRIAQKSVLFGMAVFVFGITPIFNPSGNPVKLPVDAEPEDFNTIVIAQSDTPCAWEDIPVEDLFIFEVNYDWDDYLHSWETVDLDASDGYLGGAPTEELPVEVTMDFVTMHCGSKLQYVVQVSTLHFNSTKAYTYVGFVQRDNLSYAAYELPSYLTIAPADWQKTENVGTVQAAMNNYDCVEVIVTDAQA